MSALALLAGAGSVRPADPVPPPGDPVEPGDLLPPPPSEDAAALRFKGGSHVYVEQVTPETSEAQIAAWFTRTLEMRGTFGVHPLDYRLTLAMEPGTYHWPAMPDGGFAPWTSLISATGTGDPSDVVIASGPPWGTLSGGAMSMEGITIEQTTEKYPIHAGGPKMNIVHCLLHSKVIGWGSGHCIGTDGYPGDTFQIAHTKFLHQPSTTAIITHHATHTEGPPVSYRLRNLDLTGITDGKRIAYGGNRDEVIWVEDTPGLTWSARLIEQATPLVWTEY